jgi:catechol 2,3-dioxygenase-like lactoylglutathione lyase family enzyme
VNGRIHHVGIAVADLASARRFLEGALGFRLETSYSAPEGSVEAGFFSLAGGVQVELFQLGDPEARARRLGEGNVGRLEHIAIEVDDVELARDELRSAGVEMQGDRPALSKMARSYFTRPETTGGVVYQLLDRQLP